MPHIFKEILKTLKPSLAYTYPASAVVLILCMFGVSASFPHVDPSCEFGRFAESMGSQLPNKHFPTQASTGFSSSLQEVLSKDGTHFPAFALAKPYGILRCSAVERHYREPAVFLPNHIHGHNPSQQHTITPTYISVKVHYV